MKTTRQNQGIAKDQKGRDLFETFAKALNITIVAYSEGRWARWDVAYNQDGQKTVSEIKVRNITSTRYSTYILEVSKLNALRKAVGKRHDVKITYINLFEDGVMYIFDLTDLDLDDYVIHKQYLPVDDWGSEMVMKEVIYLNREDGVKY